MRVPCIRRWIFVPSAETTRRRSIQSRAVVVEVWAFIHLATYMAIGIPSHTYFSHATIASTAWTMGMATLKKGTSHLGAHAAWGHHPQEPKHPQTECLWKLLVE